MLRTNTDMELKYELRRIDKANKSNPHRADILLDICIKYVPEESRNAIAYISKIREIDDTWRSFARENGLYEYLFREWSLHNLDISSAIWW